MLALGSILLLSGLSDDLAVRLYDVRTVLAKAYESLVKQAGR